MKEKVVLKKKLFILNIEETETLASTYDRPFHMSQIHIKLPKNQTAQWENVATRNCVLEI